MFIIITHELDGTIIIPEFWFLDAHKESFQLVDMVVINYLLNEDVSTRNGEI